MTKVNFKMTPDKKYIFLKPVFKLSWYRNFLIRLKLWPINNQGNRRELLNELSNFYAYMSNVSSF